MKLQVTNVFRRNKEAWPDYQYIVNQGGTRSSKTYSIAQLFIVKLLENPGNRLTVVRKTLPSLRSSVMRDFFEILQSVNLYDERLYNKTEKEYRLGGGVVEFMSLDQPQKKRGTKRDWLWLNEANEFTKEDFFQLNIRTTGIRILDYNPSDEFHWIYDDVVSRKDCKFIQSTYKDNPFLDKSIVEEIERLKDQDDNYWRVYGLGERGTAQSVIYTNWEVVDAFPENCDEEQYGIDFGYNNPTAVLRVGVKDKLNIYIDELLYETKLTNSDLISRFPEFIDNKNKKIKADSAEPDRIEEISRAGYWIEGCRKGKNSVKDGIDSVKRYKIFVTKRSVNVIKEIKSYKWKEDQTGRIIDEPVKFNDHAMDALRYTIGDIEDSEVKVTFI